MKKLLMAMLGLMMGLMIMTGCSSQTATPTPAEKPQPKPAEFVTGRVAFQKASHRRTWLGTRCPTLPSRIHNYRRRQGQRGKVGHMASILRLARATWSEVLHLVGRELAPTVALIPARKTLIARATPTPRFSTSLFSRWTQTKHSKWPRSMAAIKFLPRPPDIPVIYVLDWSSATNELIWHVIYGVTRDDYKLRVAVNASSGDFIRVEK